MEHCNMCAGKHSDSCGATSTTTSMTSTTTSTSSSSSPSGNDIAPLADMVNFFEGEHGRDASYYTGHSGGCLMWDSDLAQELTVVAVSTDDMYQGLACGTCVRVTSMTQRGGGDVLPTPFTAIIGDLCEDCQQGDLDFAIADNDGRHDLIWEPVPCPVNNEPIQFRLSQSLVKIEAGLIFEMRVRSEGLDSLIQLFPTASIHIFSVLFNIQLPFGFVIFTETALLIELKS